MKKLTRGINGLLVGLVAGGLFFIQPVHQRPTVTDSVVQPTSGQTAVQLSDGTHKGHVQMKTQKTTSQAGKTVSRQTTTVSNAQHAKPWHGVNK
ncbi:hypothetical protein FD13_GL001664 [Levilactobacillus senmaizukei DSM 21775 = NBRC 103853]|uniref:Uncharacterized protein n=1 Tax=Levilactobacillus senmaizukei DSM 21775 = NBRC 103853 TaxID=1423803 RepID=A0A0R2DFB5_9LACO|nr:hypothetical protein [Levilactobacillus senmaizukei]KRN02670.1 hypothetical protein FD13_GL001664 [Levilactobacillus senmaizukei DSM 21775 = NBRC 103853]